MAGIETKRDPLQDQHGKVIKMVDDYIDATVDARQLADKCRDYYDNKQWSAAEIATLKKRKQPIVTINRIKPKVQFLLGMENQARTDPKAFPRNPEDQKGGELTTDALRYVADNNHADQKFTDGFENLLIEGVEAHEVGVRFKGGRFEIGHNHLSFDRIFFDPHSRAKDFDDAKFFGMLEWMDEEDVLEMDGATEEAVTFTDESTGDTHDDKPSFWVDKNRKRVRVFWINFKIRNVWHFAVFSKGAFIQKPIPSPYLDEDGEPEPQFVFQSAFIDRENNRYSEVRSYLDPQDEVNHRRSRFLHLVNTRQTFGNQGAVPDPSKVKSEMNKADGHVEIKMGKFGSDFGIIPTGDMAQSQFALLNEAKGEIDSAGANATLQGQDQRTLSGTAFDKLQKGGVVEVGTLFDRHRNCKLRVWRMYFNRIKQFWKEPRWVRVTDDNNAPKFVGLNIPVTMGQIIEQQLGAIPPEFANDPRLEIPVGEVENPVNELDVDIVLDEAPDLVTLQGEQFELLVRMWERAPDQVPLDFVIEASAIRNKQQFIDRVKGGTPEQQEEIAQANKAKQEEADALLKASSAALILKDESSANLNNAKAQSEIAGLEQIEADVEKTDAQTDQIEVDTTVSLEQIIR